MSDNSLEFAQKCVDTALSSGADAADAILFDSSDVTVRQRMGKIETIERAESKELGLRVFVKDGDGLKQAIVSSNDISEEGIPELAERAVAMAKVAPPDPYTGLAPEELLVKEAEDYDIYDAHEPSEEDLKKLAAETEEAALAVEGVTNSEGADASYGTSVVALVASNGFAKNYDTSSCSVSASVIAGEGTSMEVDYDYSLARHVADLRDAAEVGRNAGERAVKRLNPKKISSCQVPIVFDARTARSLVRTFASSINGAGIARGTSFLKDRLGKEVFAKGINIIDDPHRKRGIATEPFDAEGVAGIKHNLIDDGVLTTWLLDLRSAKQLGLTSTGHASRGTSSPPSPSSSNLYMEAGSTTPEELMADIKEGIYITDAFGMGVNTITGDYSQGASGFWIENGQFAYPVSEITIAGHLGEMFKQLTPANDLHFHYGTNAPTIRIEGMTVAGV